MKKTILFLLLLTSLTTFAHEDIYKAVEKSNVQIKIQVGYEDSWELRIVESYAEIINDFIREIDSTEKVFIQFSEDYCFSYDDLFFLAYGDFKDFVTLGFPWGYKYDMKYINTQKGVNIIISEKYFKLKTLLQLLEFGVQNKNYIAGKENIFSGNGIYREHKFENASIMDSIMQSNLSDLANKYLSKRVNLRDIPKVLTQKNIELFLQNDSILFVDTMGTEILRLSTLNSISCEDKTNCLFILNTNHSFYFINRNLKSNQKQYNLPFEIGCIDAVWIEFVNKKYKLEKDGLFRLAGSKNESKYWIYFDEINGVTNTE